MTATSCERATRVLTQTLRNYRRYSHRVDGIERRPTGRSPPEAAVEPPRYLSKGRQRRLPM